MNNSRSKIFINSSDFCTFPHLSSPLFQTHVQEISDDQFPKGNWIVWTYKKNVNYKISVQLKF